MTHCKQEGFTLVEILIAMVILALVLTTVYASYRGTFKIVSLSESDGDAYRMARSSLGRLIDDLTATTAYQGAVEFVASRQDFGGQEASGLVFRSAAHIAFTDGEPAADIATIGYYVVESPGKDGLLLMRSDNVAGKVHTVDEKGEGLVVCEKVKRFVLRFYDSSGREYDAWSSATGPEEQKNKAPAVVAVYLELTNSEGGNNPYRFMTKVFLPMNKISGAAAKP